jgi:preprotein translocase subunit SecA
MIGFIVKKLIGSKNDREVRKLRPLLARINELETALQSKPEEHLRELTAGWKARCAAGRWTRFCRRRLRW